MTLRRPFVTATAVRSSKQTIWVRVVHAGIEGWGEAVPADTYGQSLESAERTLHAAVPLLEKADPEQPAQVTDALLARFDDQRATVAAIDAALYDWLGKARGQSVMELLGVPAGPIPPTSVTLGIDSPETLAAKAAELAGFPVWKVKIGTAAESETLALVRRLAPTQRIRVDANTGWTADDALERLRRVAAFDLELVEQPVRREDLDTLRRLRAAALCPIVADESCVVPADVPRVAGAVDGINIKLSKCGGITEARRMISAARSAGLRVMLGCMIESSLGISTAAQLAPLVDWLDLDGHLLISDDPFEGLGGAGGVLTPGRAVGLGVWPRARA
ncbi:MAG: dipeptide epimerase [Phycisphaerae bacterium]